MVSISPESIAGGRHVPTIQKRDPANKIVTLVCITDMSEHEMIDDGPHIATQQLQELTSMGKIVPINPGRRRLLDLHKKRDGAGNKLWYAKAPGVTVYDPRTGMVIEFPVLASVPEPVKQAHAELRQQRAESGKALLDSEKKKKDAENAATETLVVNALGKLLGKAADDQPAKKSKPAKDGE